jgi:dTDP-4-dehydrorhamnose 3,5-epimerase
MDTNNTPPARSIPVAFSDGPIDGVITKALKSHDDHRGWLIELFRDDEMPEAAQPAMCYISQTLEGVARGPHEHAFQTDYFAFIGPGDFTLYLWDIRTKSPSFGKKMKLRVGHLDKQAVIVPPGVVHAYKNTGVGPGWVVNLPNQLYAGRGKKESVDETRHEDTPNSPFILD